MADKKNTVGSPCVPPQDGERFCSRARAAGLQITLHPISAGTRLFNLDPRSVLEQRGSGKQGPYSLVQVSHSRQFAALPVSHWQLAEPPTTRRNRPRLTSPDSRRMSREKPSCIPPWQRIPVGNQVCGEKVASATLGDAFVPAVSDRSQAT